MSRQWRTGRKAAWTRCGPRPAKRLKCADWFPFGSLLAPRGAPGGAFHFWPECLTRAVPDLYCAPFWSHWDSFGTLLDVCRFPKNGQRALTNTGRRSMALDNTLKMQNGSTDPFFGALWAPFCSPLAPFWLPFGLPWLTRSKMRAHLA